jgi:hypothetical protein
LIIRWIVILLSAYLSYLTYRFVETKIRNQKSALVPLFLSFGLFILGLGGIKIYFDGGLLFPNLFFVKAINKGATDATDVLKYLSETTVSCNSDIFPEASKENGLNCGQSQPGKPEILILGDSHAQHLFAGIHEANPNRNIAYATTAVPSSLTSALPLFEHPLFKEIYQNIFAEKSVRAVILNASWAAKIGQIPPSVNLGIELERIAQALEQQGKKLYLVTDVPNFPFHAGRCKYNGRLGSSSKCSMSQSDLDRQYQSYIGYLRTVEREYSNVELIDISYKFCNGVSCEMAQSGNLLYYDGGHLSVYGSKLAFTKTIE